MAETLTRASRPVNLTFRIDTLWNPRLARLPLMPKMHKYILTLGFLLCLFAPLSERLAFAQADSLSDDEPSFEQNPLLREPETPEQLFDAVVLLDKLGRVDLASKYLDQLMKSEPADATILELRDKYGPSIFLRFGRNKDLLPASKQLLDQMNAAFLKEAYSSNRFESLVNDLKAGGGKQQIALTALRDLGAPIVPALLKRYSTETDDTLRDTLLTAIVQIGKPAVPVLIGGILAPSVRVQEASIQALGWMNDRSVISYLWYPAFGPEVPAGRRMIARIALQRILDVSDTSSVSRSNLAAELTRLTQTHLRNAYSWDKNPAGNVEFWVWDPQNESLVMEELTPEEASLLVGAHFAEQSLALAPDDQEAQATYLSLALAAEYHQVGWDQPLPTGPGTVHNLALTSGPDIVTEALRISLDNTNVYSILATLQTLGQVASEQQLTLTDARRAPILSALNYPSFRVQFAAATTILQIDPDRAFPGSDRVVSVLAQALNDSRSKRAVVIDPDQERNQVTRERLEDRGFKADVFLTGRDGFTHASSRMDVELIMIHINSIRWSLSQTIANLRADARTASIPIIIYGPVGQEYRLLELLDRTPLSTFMPQTIDPVLFNKTFTEFVERVSPPDMSPELREMQVATAAYWLSYISAGRRTNLFDLAPAEKALNSGVNNPKLARDCLIALAGIPSKSAQRTLLSTALQAQLEPQIRSSAGYQMAYHVQRHGWLLDEADAQDLHRVYESEAESDVATALAAVIGSLKPNSKLIGERLQDFRTTQ